MAYDSPRPDLNKSLEQLSTPPIRVVGPRPRFDNNLPSGIWIPVRKTVDETIAADTVLSTDAMLFFAMLASAKYAIRARIWFDTVAAADFKWALSGPALNSIRVTRRWIVPGTAAWAGIAVDTAGYTASQSIAGAGTTGGYVEIDANVRPSSAGTFAFQWAQDTSDAGNTTVLAGSYLEYMVI